MARTRTSRDSPTRPMNRTDYGFGFVSFTAIIILWKHSGLSWWIYAVLFLIGMVINLVVRLGDKEN
jgi:hypothetical protein